MVSAMSLNIQPLNDEGDMSEVKFKGIVVILGGISYVLPPLSLAAMEVMEKELAAFTGGTDGASIRTVVDAVHSALKRNYPNIERQEVAEGLDLGNMGEVMEAVMDVSGLKRKSIEAEAEAGKVVSGIGENSTPTSVPAPAGESLTSGTT